MNKVDSFITDADLILNAFGGENLSGSGFESEIPEPEFATAGNEPEGTGR